MKKLMAVSAFAVAFGLLADEPVVDEPAASGLINKAGFEEENYSLESSEGGSYYWTQPTGDASSIKSYGGEGLTAPTIRTKEFADTPNAKYLELSTEGGTLLRGFKPTDAADKTQAVGDGVYIDTLVQFTAMEDSDPTIDPADKIAVWLGVKTEDNVTTTNLYVKAGSYCTDEDGDNAAQGEPAIYALQYANGSAITVEPEKWYRLTIQALPVDIPNFACFTGFKISLNDQALKTATAGITPAYMAAVYDADAGTEDYGEAYEAFVTAYGSAIQNNEIIPSLEEMKDSGSSSALTLTSVGFAGSGAIDDLVLTTDDPLETSGGGTTVLITLSVPTGVTGSYSVDGGTTWTAIPANGSVPVEKDSGIWLKGTVGVYEQVKKFTATEDATLAITTATSDMAWYFPRTETEGQDGTSAETAFEIATANDLVALKDAVAAGVATAGVYFKQTADINFAGASFEGIGTYKDGVAGTAYFAGIYDGGNNYISNIVFSAGSKTTYKGVFVQVAGGTVQNLKVKDITISAGTGDVGGAMVVGNLVSGAVRNVTTEGYFVNAENNGLFTHNVGGIICRMKDGLVSGCTNNVDLAGTYTKAAGIVVLIQSASNATIENCANTGSITCTTRAGVEWNDKGTIKYRGNDGTAGILGYMSSATVKIENCSNTGVITGGRAQSGNIGNYVYDGSIIGKFESTALTATGCSALANIRSVGNDKNVDGLTFATVDNNGVATFVAAPEVGGSYKVMAPGGTVTLVNVGDTITLDTSLKTATVTTTAENAEVQKDGNVYTVVALASGIVADLDALTELAEDIKDLDDEDKETLNSDWAEFKGSASLATAADQALALKNFLLGATAVDAENCELVAKIEMGSDGKPEVTWWRKEGSTLTQLETAPAYVTRKIKWSVDVTFPANVEGQDPVTGEVDEGATIPPAAKFFKTLIKLGK